MSSVLSIPEEQPKGEQQSRLELFYQEMLTAQMQRKAADPVARIEQSHDAPDDKPQGEDSQKQDRYESSGGGGDKPTYSRGNLGAPSRAGDLKTPALGASQDGQLDADDAALLRRLQARDAEVRLHEMRHVSALGAYAGAVQFNYQIGPDGRAYAIGGSTEVRASGPSDSESSAQRARVIRNAALAGGDPSQADLSVAASATESEQAAMAKRKEG